MAPYQSKRHLPADLFREILRYLPVKSLLRFRCVSKPWLALVNSDADFDQLHLKTFKNNSDERRLFVVQTLRNGKQEGEVRDSDTFEPIPEILPPPAASPPNGYVITNYSVDGLILLQSAVKRVGQFGDFKVWNPSIRKLLEIPTLFEPQVSPHDDLMDIDIGFGYDPVTNNYKIIKLIFISHTLHSVAIYALGADSWRMVNFQGSNWHWDMNGFDEAVYYRGNLYFIAVDEDKDDVWDLVWFDLNKEMFSSSRLPDDPNMGLRHYEFRRLMLFKGGFAVQVLDMDSSTLWALDNESMCWTKPQLYSLREEHLWHIKKNGDMLTGTGYYDYDKMEAWNVIGSYNCETKEYNTLQRRRDSCTTHVSCYVESLILHKLIR